MISGHLRGDRAAISGRSGLYATSAADNSLLRTWGVAVVEPSKHPVPRRPTINDDGRLHVRAPNVAGRSIVLVRCLVERDAACGDSLSRAICSRSLAQIVLNTHPDMPDPTASLVCRPLAVLGLKGWVAAESHDERTVECVSQVLRPHKPLAAEFDLSLLDYVAFVVTR